MSKHLKSRIAHSQLSWLLPILALSPLSLAAKGCNAGVVGNECPTASDCPTGTAGKGSAGSTGGESKQCGGLLGTGCADDELCSYPRNAQCGAADQTGECVPKPEQCDLIYSPVCGCDDQTYGNDCDAKMAGVSVAYDGECQSSGGGGTGGGGTGGTGGSDFCGGIANIACPPDQYCDYPLTTKCGSGDQGGSCKPVRDGCEKILKPVCGCDGKTYDNACLAGRARVSVAAEGACQPASNACGEIGDCPDGEYCNFPLEANCGVADRPGVCTPLPGDQGCPANYDPVCGCDGKTYGNACAAHIAGMSIASDGECEEPTGEICGGLLGAGCQDGYFCDFPAQMACGNADGTGVCVRAFEVCPTLHSPVCGCDGRTYSNECIANSAGYDVSHAGVCN